MIRQRGTDGLVAFCTLFLRHRQYVRNPYLRAKLVEVLLVHTPDLQEQMFRNHHQSAALDTIPLVVKHLAPALMEFYADLESSVSFYEKFNIRYNITLILKHLWNNPGHVAQVRRESLNVDKFVRFTNMLMNDATYLLDEALTKLAEIKHLQQELEDASRTPQQRTETETRLLETERHAKTYMMLGNETVYMMAYLTKVIKEPFLRAEIVDRLAAMLNFNLVILVGPKCTELKVRNPEEYGFSPKEVALRHY